MTAGSMRQCEACLLSATDYEKRRVGKIIQVFPNNSICDSRETTPDCSVRRAEATLEKLESLVPPALRASAFESVELTNVR